MAPEKTRYTFEVTPRAKKAVKLAAVLYGISESDVFETAIALYIRQFRLEDELGKAIAISSLPGEAEPPKSWQGRA